MSSLPHQAPSQSARPSQSSQEGTFPAWEDSLTDDGDGEVHQAPCSVAVVEIATGGVGDGCDGGDSDGSVGPLRKGRQQPNFQKPRGMRTIPAMSAEASLSPLLQNIQQMSFQFPMSMKQTNKGMHFSYAFHITHSIQFTKMSVLECVFAYTRINTIVVVKLHYYRTEMHCVLYLRWCSKQASTLN